MENLGTGCGFSRFREFVWKPLFAYIPTITAKITQVFLVWQSIGEEWLNLNLGKGFPKDKEFIK